MTSFSLYERFIKSGTLSEPGGVPDPQKALPSSVHWMRALRLVIEHDGLTYASAKGFYSGVQQIKLNEHQQNTVLEKLLLGLHQLAALQSMTAADRQADIARMAVIAWYYGVYAAASAMVTAQEGTAHETHAQIAKAWQNQFARRQLAMYPFDLQVTTLVKSAARAEVDALLRGAARANLMARPNSLGEAHQALCGYLSGSATWYRERAELKLKREKAYKDLGVSDFRTRGARALRDDRLAGATVCFVHQAFRFRGKANYREALFLAHGRGVENTISEFVRDMAIVLHAILAMAGAFAFQKLGLSLAKNFLEDLDMHRAFSIDPRVVWTLA